MSLAVITARAGSKRIPRKNIRSFAGDPIITWPIKVAQESGLFKRIIVSTDDEEIASVARTHGAEVPFVRPAEVSDDHSGTAEVMAHAVSALADLDIRSDTICCIYPTAVFLKAGDLAEGATRLAEGPWDYVLAAGEHRHSVWRAFTQGSDGGLALLFPEYRPARSQDLPPVFHDAGQFYWGRAEAWLEMRPIIGSRTAFVRIPADRVQDIDTPEDWMMAERLFHLMQGAA